MLDPLLVVEPGGQRCFECDKPLLSLSFGPSQPESAPASICHEAAAVNRTHLYSSAVADDRVGPC